MWLIKLDRKLLPPLLRYVLLALAISGFLIAGFVREQYIINLSEPELPLLIDRYNRTDSLPVNVLDQGEQQNDPRWFTLPLYLLLYVLLSGLTMFLLFQHKNVWAYVLIGYGSLLFAGGIFLLMAKFGLLPSRSYATAQQLKELMLSPFLPLMLIALYYAATNKRLKE